ncbi:hypothetical protein [Cryptosporangium aurantiacum]|uniref:Intracellular septation protein A n=1 Tax=Cryptosporangium aurantiacum TaxID=134849 RepID=A0A1M7QEU8_9ACTN|nr:hypothetical protein [Cryptosporangium aurantiacum]SHN29441.1 hypothetical protein SAMN05443668_104568 [Cryptosporangium aurantiacum]
MVVYVLAACEIGFWAVLLAGLVARYVFGLRKIGAGLLLSTALVDLVALTAAIIDLRGGATADWTHGLAAMYIGFSVAFGPMMVRWADQRFAHRFAEGPAPTKPPKYGMARARYEWTLWIRAVVACGISAALLFGAIRLIDDHDRTAALDVTLSALLKVVVIWGIVALTYTVFPKRANA